MINIKTQTKRTTKMITDISNINLFLKDFEIGIKTTENWGVFKPIDIPIIQLTIEDKSYEIPLDVFISKIKKVLKNE